MNIQVNDWNGGAFPSVEAAAKAAGLSRTTVYNEIRAGRITARKLGRRTLVEKAEIDRFLKNLPAL